ncbi:MAG: DUF4900 domain-containing protein [Candidatus Omnitrophota bacterium]
MIKLLKNNKGVILLLVCLVMMVLLILTGVFFSSTLSEKRFSDTQRFSLQALGLAEAGVNHGVSEFRERIRTDLQTRVGNVHQSNVIKNYVDNNNSLGFLRDYAYAQGDTQFSVAGNQATLQLNPLGMNTQVNGNYTTTITVTPNGNPTNPSTDVYIFPYKFTIEALGSVTTFTPAVQRRIKLLEGRLTLTVQRANFARYALFTSHHGTPSGTTVWFTEKTNFTGPVHTNERFSFANNPSATFTEEVTQHHNTARFYNQGSPILLNADSNPPWDVPIFQNGFTRGVNEIVLPSALTQNDLKNQALGTMGQPGQNGIYVPNDGTNVTGGIYIRGDANSVTMGLDGDGNQTYTIVQSGTTKTITVDYVANTTEVQTSGQQSVPVYQGIPDGIDNEGVIIYDQGAINNFSGTVGQASQVTVSTERDIVIQNHITYEHYNAGPPLNAVGYKNLLGIISWGGNVRIGTSAPNDLQIHGVVMSVHGIFTVDNYNSGSPRGTVTLLGGAITDFYGAFGTFSGTTQRTGYGRNFVYDARMLQGYAPPYFPYLPYFTSNEGDSDNDGIKDLDEKIIWREKSPGG